MKNLKTKNCAVESFINEIKSFWRILFIVVIFVWQRQTMFKLLARRFASASRALLAEEIIRRPSRSLNILTRNRRAAFVLANLFAS